MFSVTSLLVIGNVSLVICAADSVASLGTRIQGDLPRINMRYRWFKEILCILQY
jgi:hypothetical protein